MLDGGWTPEDLEHWAALRFRLKIFPASLHKHFEYCMKHLPLGAEVWEVAGAEAGLVLYSDITGQSSQERSSGKEGCPSDYPEMGSR